MSTPHQRQRARRSDYLGDRVSVTVKLSTDYKAKLDEWVRATGQTRSDLLVDLIERHLDTLELPQAQESFDLKIA